MGHRHISLNMTFYFLILKPENRWSLFEPRSLEPDSFFLYEFHICLGTIICYFYKSTQLNYKIIGFYYMIVINSTKHIISSLLLRKFI